MIELTERLVRITLGQMSITSKLIDGRFPEWRRVVPADLDKSATLDRAALLQALNRIGILSNDKYRGVRASFGPGVLRLTAANIQQEESQEDIDIAYDADAVTIGFNIAYLSDAIRAISAEQVEMHFIDATGSSRIVVPDAPDDIYVVMPMRL